MNLTSPQPVTFQKSFFQKNRMSKSLVLQKVLLMNQKQHRLPMNPVFFENLEYNWKMLFYLEMKGFPITVIVDT